MLKSEVVQLDPKIRDGCQTLDEIIGEISEMKCLLHPCYIKAMLRVPYKVSIKDPTNIPDILLLPS